MSLKRVLIFLFYILITALLLGLIGSVFDYLNSGADRSKMLRLEDRQGKFYHPLVQWDTLATDGRIPTKTELLKIETDYINALYLQQYAVKFNDSSVLEDYFTEKGKIPVIKTISKQIETELITKGTTLEHKLWLKFLSVDGQFAILEDRDVTEYNKVFRKDQFIGEFFNLSTYRIILLLEDGNWRIRDRFRTQLKEVTYQSTPALDTKEILGINYYPQDNPWDMFGENYSSSQIRTDFEFMRSKGFNTIRVFLPYHNFGASKVEQTKLEQLSDLLDQAQENDIKAIVTLFDFYGNYDLEDWHNTNRHLYTVVNKIKSHPALYAWDLKNEPDLDFESRGKNKVLSWLNGMTHQLKNLDPDHPVTIGWSKAEHAHQLEEKLDFISFHFYEEAKLFEASLINLKNRVPSKPIVLTEYGRSTYSGFWNLWAGSEQDQAEYHQTINTVLEEESIGGLLWTLYDFESIPSEVVGDKPWRKNPQKHFGLINTEGREKPALNAAINR